MPSVVRRLVITGRVQGVGYRISCAREADRLGVRGWVRNLADGSVEVVAAGPPELVEGLTGWCRRGPRGARVERVVDQPAGDAEIPAGRFEIRG